MTCSKVLNQADYSCLVFQGKDIIEIEKQLSGDFTNICEWFVDNRLRIHSLYLLLPNVK